MKRYLGGSWAPKLLFWWRWAALHWPPPPPPRVDEFTNLQASKPTNIGIFMEASSCRPAPSLTPFSVLLPSQDNVGVELKFQASNFLIPSFLGTSSTHKPPRGSLRFASLEQKTLPSPRNYKGSQEPYIRNQSQGPNIRARDVPCALITFRKLQGSQDLCARNQRQRPIYRFSIISQMCCQTSDHVGNWHLTLLGRWGSTLEHVSQMTHTSAKGLGSLSPRQSLVLLPKDLNCPVFPACCVPVNSHWCPEKVFSPKTKLANEVRLASMGMASIVWTLTVSHTTGLSLPHVRMLTPCGVPMVRLCDT